jgi:hypothetical protein
MNKKVLGIAVLLLAVAILATPFSAKVKADKTDGQWVPLSSIITGPPSILPGEIWVTDGGIIQIRGQQLSFTALTTIGGTTYPVYVNAVFDATFNPKTGVFNTRIDNVWYIGGQGSPNGFAGNTEAKYFGVTTLPPATSASWLTEHMLLQGFGSFEGQVIIASYDGPPPFSTLTGYCLIKG